MIKKILVPVDFSDTAADAMRYALAFGFALGEVEICIAHVFMPQVDSEYPNFIPPMPEMTNARFKMLEAFCGEIREFNELQGIRPAKEVWIGFPADEIVRRSGEFDIIIMGTTGEGGLMDKVFGSVSTAVAQRADCPVILVPSGAAYSRINRVLYAGHYDAADTRMVERLVAFNALFRACVHFVHVKGAGAQAERFQEEKEQIFSVLFREGEPAFAFEIAEIEGDSVAEALNTYAENNNMELVVLVTRRRNFWAQLFHKSVTRGLVRIARQPLMVLHLD